MPHSLRTKIKGLRYKGIITDKDCDRLCKSLDNEDALDKIRAEIEQGYCKVENNYDQGRNMGLHIAVQIIDKYRESEG